MKLFNKLRKLFLAKLALINAKRKVIFKKTYLFIQRKPFTSFFAVLGIFLLLMIIGNVLFSPTAAVQSNQLAPKQVQIYKLGSAPLVSYQGKVEKSGVIKIIAQTSGIVSAINVSEGQQIDSGTNILSLSTNYSGGNAATISRQIAQDQYQNAQDTYNTQIDVIVKERDNANKNKENADLQKQITTQSATDTQALFDLNKTIVDSINSNIQSLESTNVNGSNDAAILQAKQQLSGFQSAMAQTSSSYQNLQIQASDNAGTIANNSLDIVLEQLDIQEKALNMSLDISKLSFEMAKVMEANMFPSTPFAGTVNKIFVHIGDNVSSGTPLASITGNNQNAEIVADVPEDIAKNISNFEPSTLYVGNKSIQMLPTFVSKDATNGVFYSVIYDLDNSMAPNLTDATYIDVKIPVGTADTTNIDPFIPLDSILQTQDEAYVYVVDAKNIARVKKISLGQIQGRYVEVLSGLPRDAEIITNRNVIEGDKVSVSN